MKDKIINFISNIIITFSLILIFANLFLIVNSNGKRKDIPTIFGYSFLIEMSNSMQPILNVGDLIIIKEKEQYDINDIISYQSDEGVLVTHRIIDIQKDDKNTYFKTQGDNNQTADMKLVNKKNVAGTLVTNINEVGNYILFLATPTGMLVLILVVVTIFLVDYMIKKIKEETN